MVHFNFGIICDDKIILYDNEEDYSSRISNSTFLVNVDAELCRHNVLSLQGDKILYDLYIGCKRRVFEKDWEHQPHESEIHEGKKYFWSKNKSKYVNSGWVKRADKEHISVVLINYKITIIKDVSDKKT
jgi:hypothetical protein